MDTVNLNQLTTEEGGIYLLGEVPFSGFAIETFPDGKLQTQMALMHGRQDGRQDGVTRRWHPNGQLESEKGFRNGQPHGQHREWAVDGTLKGQSSWNAGACTHSSRPERAVLYSRPAASDTCVTHYEYDLEGRQTSVRVDTDARPSACIAELLAMNESADEPPEEPEN